jgi:outer membrane protein OmpA-like peptidoglycan-associated protein
MTKLLLRLVAVAALGVGASACSSVPDWVDPTTWMDNSPQDTADNGGTAPDLADIPAKPATTTSDDQKQVADSLAADRTQANYSADQLRADQSTTPSAAPPPDAPPATTDNASTSSSSSNTTVAEATTPDNDQPAPSADTPLGDTASADSAAPTPGVLPPETPPPTQVASAEPPPALPPTQQSSMLPPAPGHPVSVSDAELGFKPSSAPPLDPSVKQFASSSSVTRYEQTASLNSDPSSLATSDETSTHHRHHRSDVAMGGPEAMSGDVVANMDVLDDAPQASPATYADASGTPPAAVVFFPGDGVLLNAESRAKIKEAVAAYQAKGGQGFIKVIGHSSSRTSNMPVEQHLELIYRKSQERANAVAKEIISQGVPADKVLVEAVGDAQPVYYESMPKGEVGNRRAEIFFQS